MLIRQGNCCFLEINFLKNHFVTYVTEIDSKIINNNVRQLCMTFVFNFVTILPKRR